MYSYVREANGKAGYVVRDVHDSPTEIDPGVHVLDVGRDLGCANPEEKKKMRVHEAADGEWVQLFTCIIGAGGDRLLFSATLTPTSLYFKGGYQQGEIGHGLMS